MWEPEELDKENPCRRAYRYAREKFQQYAADWRTAKKAVCDDCRAKYEQYGRWRYIKRAIAVLTVVGVWVYTGITACILTENSSTNFISRDTENRTLRAYIGVFTMQTTIFPFDKGGFAFIANAELRNFGQTPAYDVKGHADWKIDGPGTTPYEKGPGSNTIPSAGPMMVAHNAPFNVTEGARIPDEDVAPLRGLSKMIYLWGDVRYRDTFDQCHRFIFRLRTNYFAPGGQTVLYMGGDPAAKGAAIFEADISCEELSK